MGVRQVQERRPDGHDAAPAGDCGAKAARAGRARHQLCVRAHGVDVGGGRVPAAREPRARLAGRGRSDAAGALVAARRYAQPSALRTLAQQTLMQSILRAVA